MVPTLFQLEGKSPVCVVPMTSQMPFGDDEIDR